MDEARLVQQAQQGDHAAFEQLVLKHQNKVYTLAVHLIRDRDEAADLAQEAFLKAWQNLSSFQGESSFSTWMHRLTTNICLDYLRKQARRQDIAPSISLDDEEAAWNEPVDHTLDPQHKLEHMERKDALRQGLEQLPEHHRRPLVMREISGLSYQEIAQALELDLGTVKSRIARARLNLRKILLQNGNFFGFDTSNDTENKTRR